ncbi:MAG: 2-C-methyl-D-erythritol 4-phosphate cytidylyltransferase [Planctomycetes bacterium]|nr:2-C-methyl-D-erythritol 4-phosphate cytidylyltransferase [Planctomycetota bacterium]
MSQIAAIICAAGSSSRFGGKKKKPFVDVAGRAAFLRSVELFTERSDVKQVILAIAPDDEEIVKIKWGANLSFFGVGLCFGGKERFETVDNALKLLKDDIDLVAVHDAARCCVTAETIQRVIEAAQDSKAAIPACPVIGTLKAVETGAIARTVDRQGLFEAQTPQIFDRTLLIKAYKNLPNLCKEGTYISDDAQLVEQLGHRVTVVETDSTNIKITHPTDTAIAEAILKTQVKNTPKGPINPYREAQW